MTILNIKKFILSKILGRKYYRTGKCNACGKCCRQIYVKHYKHVIQDEEEFKKLQYLHRFYTYLKVIGKDEIGLVFECTNLDPETHKCKIHKNRPGICRRYPQEELFSMGGALSDDCGYRMEPIVPFSKILEKTQKKFERKQFSATCLSPSRVPTPWLRCLIRHSQKSAHVPYREFLFGQRKNKNK